MSLHARLERLERATLTGLLALPERVQRPLAGRRIVRDGQVLATDVQLSLRLKELAREPGPETLPLPGARAAVLRQARLTGGEQAIGAVRDFEVAGRPARLYTPTTPGDGLLVFFHGGAWVYGDLDSHDAVCRFLAERSGVRVLAVDYRLAPEHRFPAAYDDALAAYRWATEHAAELGADPGNLAVGGDSAGGCLATTVAIEAAREGLPLRFQLLVYPATDLRGGTASRRTFAEGFYLTQRFMDVGTENYLDDPAEVTDPRVSPLLAELPAGLAPAYVVTAGFDPLRDEGEAYARKLADAGVEVELRRFPDQIHGFVNIVGVGRTSRAAVAEVATRLRAGLA